MALLAMSLGACDHSAHPPAANPAPSLTTPTASGSSTVEHPGEAPAMTTLNGAMFSVMADRTWAIPPKDGSTPVQIALAITNTTDRPLRIQAYGTIRLHLAGPDGAPVLLDGGRNGSAPPGEMPEIAPGQTCHIERNAKLLWTKAGTNLRLIGDDPTGGVFYFDGLKPGSYTLAISHANGRSSIDPNVNVWTGDITTPVFRATLR